MEPAVATAEAEEPAIAAAAACPPEAYIDEAYEKFEPPRPIYAAKIPTAKVQRKVTPQPKVAPQPLAKPGGAKPVMTEQARQSRARARRLALLAGLPILLALVGGAIYLYVVPAMTQERVEPQTAMMAITRLRQMKSNDAWLTVDERMMQEVQRFRKEGRLRGYRGWGVKEVKGDKNKLLVMFTFDEVSGEQQRAVWLTDLVTNAYTPQTELAVAVYNR